MCLLTRKCHLSNHWFSGSRISFREGKQLDAILSKDCLLVALLGCVWRMCITDDQQGCQYTVNGGFRSLPRWWETLQPFLRKRIFGVKRFGFPNIDTCLLLFVFFAYGWFHYGTSPLNPPFGAYFFIFVPPPWANQSCLLLFCGRFRSSNPPSIDTFLQETCGVHGTWYLDPKFLEPFVSWGSFHHLVLVGMTYPPVKSPSSW